MSLNWKFISVMQGVFHMVLWDHIICGGQFWEKVKYIFDETMRRESHMGLRQFSMGESDRERHHGIALLDKCHYNFLVPLFWLQFSRILLRIKKIFQSIVCCIRLRVSTQVFYYYRLGLKTTS